MVSKAIDNLPDWPSPGGGPDPIPDDDSTLVAVVQDLTWRLLGLPKPHRIYISTQGDMWDLIAIRAYGARRGNEHLMFRLLEENWPLRNVAVFPAGVPVIVPEIAIETEIQLVPWKKASQVINP
jgi:phage tail protein X